MKKKVLFVTAFIIVLGISNVIYGRYVLYKNISVKITSAPFYFDAKEEKSVVKMENNEGSLELVIDNYNSETEYNNYDTTYEINLADESKYNIIVEDNSEGTIKGGRNTNTININFKPAPNATLKVIEEVTLVITSNTPYKKQIEKTITISQPDAELAFGGLDDFKKIMESNCIDYPTSYGTYETLYTGNNEQLEYDSNGALVFDEDNPILYLEVEPDTELFQEEYSMYFTVETDVMQNNKGFGGTIASIGNGNMNYLTWISIFEGYLHIYSYYNDLAKSNISYELVEEGFASYDISKYSNTIFNIQVVGSKTGNTTVYINGEKLGTFQSGGQDIVTSHVNIGDLRPLRNLKFKGKIYDFKMYNKVLTEEEVQNNWNYAKNKWISN